MRTPDPELLSGEERQNLHWMRQSVRSLINSMSWHDLTALERGVLQSLDVYSWWQGWLPNDPKRLAQLIRLPVAAVAKALPKLLEIGCYVASADGKRIHSPALEEEVKRSWAKWSGNKRGGEITAEKKKQQREAEREAQEEREIAEWMAANPPPDDEAVS